MVRRALAAMVALTALPALQASAATTDENLAEQFSRNAQSPAGTTVLVRVMTNNPERT